LPQATSSNVQHRADLHSHWFADALEIRQLQRQLRTVRIGDDPLSQAFAHAREDVGQAGDIVLTLNSEPGAAQRRLHRVGGCLHSVLPIGEQIDVLGRAGDNTVRQQGVPATEREAMPGRRRQRDRGDPAVQIADGHQAGIAAAARSTG
jgi:hypothetical protein